MAFNASKSTEFGFKIKNEGQGVPGDKVLLHPGDDTLASQIPKGQILIVVLTYKCVHCPLIYV